MKRYLPYIAVTFSILGFVLLKFSYDSWLVNDGLQTNLSGNYAAILSSFSSGEPIDELVFESGHGYTEKQAILFTVALAGLCALISIVIAFVSIKLKQNRQFSALSATLGCLSLCLIYIVLK